MHAGFRFIVSYPAALLTVISILWGCAGAPPVTESVTFALFGNTKPESPFRGFTPGFDTALNDIQGYKPEIIIHTGNSVYGGSDSEGIIEADVDRQMKIFFTRLKSVPTAVYTIPGESDYHNATLDLYCSNAGRTPYYSFNYGTIHFIALNTRSSIQNLLDPEQLGWLKKDLENSGRYSAIFIITITPVYSEKKTRRETVLLNSGLMDLFSAHKVRAVFSGTPEEESMKRKDNVEYYTLGCGGYLDRRENRKKYQYYIVTYNSGKIDISAQRISLK